MKTASRIALTLALSLAGCTADYVKTGNAPVELIIAAITPNPMDSDVALSNGGVCPDFATLAVANRSKNPSVTVPQVPQAIIVNRYEVSYYRTDGRGVQGVDIPYSISGNLTSSFDAKTSGTDALTIEVVRRQAKLEPPLLELAPGGQALIVTMFAKVTLYGQTIAGQNVTASATMQIDMSNFADTRTSCPTQS